MTPAVPDVHRHRIRRALKVVGGGALVVGIAIQFVPVKGIGQNPAERFALDAPPAVAAIIRQSCFDCHSNETVWPWYARLAPGSWLMARDVRKGRAHLNFSEWGDADEAARTVDKENAWDLISAGEMPPWFYLPVRPSARLTDEEKALLKGWLLAKEPPKAPADGPPKVPQ